MCALEVKCFFFVEVKNVKKTTFCFWSARPHDFMGTSNDPMKNMLDLVKNIWFLLLFFLFFFLTILTRKAGQLLKLSWYNNVATFTTEFRQVSCINILDPMVHGWSTSITSWFMRSSIIMLDFMIHHSWGRAK